MYMGAGLTLAPAREGAKRMLLSSKRKQTARNDEAAWVMDYPRGPAHAPLNGRISKRSITSAVAAALASGRLAGHPVLAFAAAADRASGLGRPAGRLGLDCSSVPRSS